MHRIAGFGARHDAARHYTHTHTHTLRMGIEMYVTHTEHVEPIATQAVPGRDDLRITFYRDEYAENPRDEYDHAGGFAVLRAGYRSATVSDGALADEIDEAFDRFHFAAHNRRGLDESEMLARWARIFHDVTLITHEARGYSQSDWAEIALWLSDAEAEAEGIADAEAYLRAGAAEWEAWMRGDVAASALEYVADESTVEAGVNGIYPDANGDYDSLDYFDWSDVPVWDDAD